MAEKLKVRNITPVLQVFRNFLLGRKHVPERATLRYSPLVSARNQDPPHLPPGCSASVSANPYCKRDGRRESRPAEVIFQNTTKKLLAPGQASPKDVATVKNVIRYPGTVYNAD